MDLILLVVQVIFWLILVFVFLPMLLFLTYILFSEYNKLYLSLVGQGNKWYQNLFIIPAGLFNLRKRRYINKNSRNGDYKNHIAIVLANNYFPENVLGLELKNAVTLIKYLKKKNKSYIVYNKVTSNKLKKIINNKNVGSIFLFGHGERHGIKVGRNEVVYYCEFPAHPKKYLIAQFHCNHFKGKSLAEYGQKPIYTFVTNDTQRQGDINRQINKIIKDKLI